jgi:hypothetical protein
MVCALVEDGYHLHKFVFTMQFKPSQEKIKCAKCLTKAANYFNIIRFSACQVPYTQEFSRDNISRLNLILPFSRGLIFASVA